MTSIVRTLSNGVGICAAGSGWSETAGEFIVINSDAYHRHPRETLMQIRQALADMGSRDLPTSTPAAWDRHFARAAA